MATTTVRPATPGDLPAVAAIFAHYVDTSVVTFEEAPPSVADWAGKLADLRARGLPFLVAEVPADGAASSGVGSRTGTDDGAVSGRVGNTADAATGGGVGKSARTDGGAATGRVAGPASGVADPVQGTIAGYAYAAPWRTKPAYRHTAENTVYLSPAQTGRGLGRALMTALVDACLAAGVRQLVAVVVDEGDGRGGMASDGGADRASKENPSLALHRSLGFTEAGRLRAVGHKHGRRLDTVLLQRSLG